MCLCRLKDFTVTQNYGWQVFSKKKTTGQLYSRFWGDEPVPVGKWQRDKFRIRDRWISIYDSLKYKKGFHIFLNKEDAKYYCPNSEDFCIKKVRFKRVVAKGMQEIAMGKGQDQLPKVVVCRKRFVEPDTGGENENTP